MQNREIRDFRGKSSMETLEKALGNHEFDVVRKRFAKNRDFHLRTAPEHGKEALWPRTRKIVDFGPKTVRVGRKTTRKTAFWCQSPPYSHENRIQKVCKTVKSADFAENPRWGP